MDGGDIRALKSLSAMQAQLANPMRVHAQAALGRDVRASDGSVLPVRQAGTLDVLLSVEEQIEALTLKQCEGE